MKKVIRLTEDDLTRIVKRVIKEQSTPTEEQKKKVKQQMDVCLTKFPKLKTYMNLDASDLTGILWMTVAPDFLLTDNLKQVKSDYLQFEACVKNLKI